MAAKGDGPALLAAAKANDLEKVRSLLESGAPADYRYHEDGTWGASEDDCPLHHALKHSNLEMAELLFAHGAKPDAIYGSTDWRGCGRTTTVFQDAGSHPNPEFLRLFLQHGADPNLVNRSTTHSMRTDGHSQSTLIHSTLSGSHLQKSLILLEAGANPNTTMDAVYHNERGYNSNNHETCLALAIQAFSGAERIQIVTELLRRGADVNALTVRTQQDPNPAWNSEMHDDPRASGFVSSVICRQLSTPPLHLAIAAQDPQLVDVLLKAGASVDIPTTRGDVVTHTLDHPALTDEIKAAIQAKASAS